MDNCYFLLYRVRHGGPINWNNPAGGLVLKPKRVYSGKPVPDLGLAEELARIRHHCAPGEKMMVVEVFSDREVQRARRLHLAYEREMNEFLELMEAG